MARALLALLLVLMIAGTAHARDARMRWLALEACAAELDPELDLGYETRRGALPRSHRGARAQPLGGLAARRLEGAPQPAVGPAGLRALHAALVRESAAAAGGARLHPERVRAVLAARQAGRRTPAGWWARFKRWLREIVTAPPQADGHWLAAPAGQRTP